MNGIVFSTYHLNTICISNYTALWLFQKNIV